MKLKYCDAIVKIEPEARISVGKNETQREKRRLKILFWCFSPILFPVFLRLYWMLFQFIYGTLFIILFGKQFAGAIAIIALITSIVFAIVTFAYIYRQYKKHIIEA
jgi:hypothetical protein